MAGELNGIQVAVLATDGVEQVELEQPWDAVTRAGAQVVLVSLHEGQIQAMNHDIEPGARFEVDAQVSDVSPADFDALILPGGTVNPDQLRTSRDAVDFVRSLVNSGRLVAAICHGPWTLVEADVVRGRTLTSYPSIRTDIRNAGGNTVDEEVVTDGNLITSRNPDDLPAFCAAIVSQLAGAARHVSG
jgi:protease I